MSRSITTILDELGRIAEYQGGWRRLRNESELLRIRAAELRDRETRRDDVLIIALAGGSGVGKSTLLNALAGDELARTSEFRPCTAEPTVYHPPGLELDFAPWRCVSGSALESLVIIDTPDSDTVVREHRERLTEVLQQCDLILLCASAEKYLDEATWSLLGPLRGERTMVCVETKASENASPREHWLARLKENGFDIADYFRVNALRSFDRKLAGRDPGDDEYDFAKFEAFLREELTTERIRRIKRSNAAGLLTKTVLRLHEGLAGTEPQLDEALAAIDTANKALAKQSFEVVKARLFAESYLWNFVLGREAGLRAKGLVGTLYRMLEALRTLPARIAGWMPGFAGKRGAAGHSAASLLSSKALFHDDLQIASEEICGLYRTHHSELILLLARADFDAPDAESGLKAFRKAVNHGVSQVLRGPARDSVMRRAQWLTGWFPTLLADIPPLAFIGWAGYIIVKEYFFGQILNINYLVHSLTVLAILLGVELLLMSLFARVLAWSARRGALRQLRLALGRGQLAFQAERAMLEEARQVIKKAEELRGAVLN